MNPVKHTFVNTDSSMAAAYFLEIRHPILEKGSFPGQDALLFDAAAFNSTIGRISYRLVESSKANVIDAAEDWKYITLSNPSVELAYHYGRAATLPNPLSFISPFVRFALLLFVLIGLVAYFTLYRASRAVLDSLRDLAERRALMIRETNHRVKNNLAIISGLIHLYRMDGHDAGGKLQDIESRINLIGLIHNRLYREPDTELVELNSYLKERIWLVSRFREQWKSISG